MDGCGVSGSGLGILVLYYLPTIIILGDQVLDDIESHTNVPLWKIAARHMRYKPNWKEPESLPGYNDTSAVRTCRIEGQRIEDL
ncbi:Uncharacterized protein HZ326_19198 [Fusarium oxysporum f. sp. albedinis]|nr:Uncharacterized protein HZ326_19198 [Fusarium oxysporum f. sp. albedinis]